MWESHVNKPGILQDFGCGTGRGTAAGKVALHPEWVGVILIRTDHCSIQSGRGSI